jgi:transcriptional regulator with XRE-family HTH domain
MNNKRARHGPQRLAAKLRQIREALKISQTEMASRLGFEELINRTHIANYERGEREPTLPALLRYAQIANVYVDALIDDSVDLPETPFESKS